MPSTLDWSQIEDLGYALWQAEPALNPLTVRFTDLRDKIVSLPGFVGASDRCNEKILEAIQMAWLEEFQDQD
jgi:FeS assembly protein IscX